MGDALEELASRIRQRRVILFAGAGVSMCVGLPSWETLIRHMAEKLGYEQDSPELSDVSYQELAEYYRLKHGSIGPLRSWMDRKWTVSPEKVRASRIHELIVSLDFPVIYTTNYDRNLEVAYEIYGKPFVKVANAKDIAKATDHVTQIVKFHGDFEEDQSLVLAETDYFDRLSFDSPMDVKFRADALVRTVLFIGYSMSDLNIRLLLHRLWQTWHRSGYEQNRPRSFVFMAEPNPIQAAVLGRWGIEALTAQAKDPEEALLKFLSHLDAAGAGRQGEDPGS
jgi:hypothetical protein